MLLVIAAVRFARVLNQPGTEQTRDSRYMQGPLATHISVAPSPPWLAGGSWALYVCNSAPAYGKPFVVRVFPVLGLLEPPPPVPHCRSHRYMCLPMQAPSHAPVPVQTLRVAQHVPQAARRFTWLRGRSVHACHRHPARLRWRVERSRLQQMHPVRTADFAVARPHPTSASPGRSTVGQPGFSAVSRGSMADQQPL